MKILNSLEIAQVSGGLDQRQTSQLVSIAAVAVTNFVLRKSKIQTNPNDASLSFFMAPLAQIVATGLSYEACNLWFRKEPAEK